MFIAPLIQFIPGYKCGRPPAINITHLRRWKISNTPLNRWCFTHGQTYSHSKNARRSQLKSFPSVLSS